MASIAPTHTALVVGRGWRAATPLRLVEGYWVDNYGMLYRTFDGGCVCGDGVTSLDLTTLTPIAGA